MKTIAICKRHINQINTKRHVIFNLLLKARMRAYLSKEKISDYFSIIFI